ncbi:uncharacterized protein LOC122506418 isoform X2 [Leptopilina heterotoma]|uniref:uncharacterized protein LOC122506418 isoform X2 n=1 Tax=Leptopilina heterotoma TaxID=63436 RepID=UPI001CA9939F|nr:uncharacterized protein LOC122506418 isoform X2 [Leptopilina heterotoma]
MRNIFSIVLLLVAFVAFTHAQIGPPRRPFPGHGPFNPHQPKPWGGRRPAPRFRRSPKDNHLTVEAGRQGGSSSYNVDYGRTVHENKYGRVIVNGGMNKEPHGRPEKHIGITGQWDF